MKASEKNKIPLQSRLAQFLLTYRNTPHSSTGLSPSQLLFKRKLRTRLDLLKPDVEENVLTSQTGQAKSHDLHVKARIFHKGQPVWIKDFVTKKWVEGTIVEERGPYSFLVRTESGKSWHKNANQLRDRSQPLKDWTVSSTPLSPPTSDPFVSGDDLTSSETAPSAPPAPLYPQRVHHPPDRFGY